MRIDFENADLGLDRLQALSVRDAAGLELRSLEGTLWITQEGASADVLLKKGESFTVQRDGLTVICAVNGKTRFSVHAARAATSTFAAGLAALLRRAADQFSNIALRSQPLGRLHGC